MALDYANLRDETVLKLMKEFGFSMTVVSGREPTIDPNTGAITAAAAEVSTTVWGLYRFFSQDEIFKALQAGQDILANDVQFLIEASSLDTAGIDPDSALQVIAQGKTYNVVRNTPTWPGGVAVLYRLQGRK